MRLSHIHLAGTGALGRAQVLRFCDGSYLEDQDHWWLSGLHRSQPLSMMITQFILVSAEILSQWKCHLGVCCIHADSLK